MPRNKGAGMSQVLVLNASYEPLNITTWRRAAVLMLKGKAESLEEDSNQKIWHDTMLPTVIRLRHFVRVPFRELPITRKNIGNLNASIFKRSSQKGQRPSCRNRNKKC